VAVLRTLPVPGVGDSEMGWEGLSVSLITAAS
jgi:hypothetical protein